jgi:beta-glucosidase
MKKVSLILAVAIWIFTGCAQTNQSKKVNTEQQNMDVFINNLMKQMTLEEKLGQLNLPVAGDITTGLSSSTNFSKKVEEGKVGGLFNIKDIHKIYNVQKLAVEKTRLKIPLLFGMDVIHGYRSVFPIPLGLACTWDLEAIQRSARIAAQEATAEGINWTFSPMVDLSRDPRWGRVAEGSGEDPFLGGEIAKAMVRGYQGNDLGANNTMMACIKHFALYGASDAGRDYGTVDMSRQRMYNEYFLPYKAGVQAGAGSVMASFNEVDGIPATGNKWLMTDVLRKEWGFNGFVVTDYTGIEEMMYHGVGNMQEVSAQALKAGIDMDMVSGGLLSTLAQSLKDGKVLQADIDLACRRILEAKYKLGLFEDPYRYIDTTRPANEVYTAANRAEARRIAAESFVLMKNENNVLPLKKQGTIAVIGPLADNGRNMVGTWAVAADYSKGVSVMQGLKEVLGDKVKILHAHGTNLDYDSAFNKRAGAHGKPVKWDSRPRAQIVAEAVAAAQQADVVLAVVGECSEMSGESSSRTSIDIPQAQRDMLMELKKTGKPIVLVLFTGRPLAIKWESENFPAILNVWFPGSEAGYAIADVLFGDVNPSGKLTTTFPQNLGQVPIFYNHKMTGRPQDPAKWFTKFKSNYLDVTNAPLYPFGFGLSYTSFTYGGLTLSKSSIGFNETLSVQIPVTNTGKVKGKEVVQLYIRDVVGSVTRPVKELKGFQKIELQPGETKTVTFQIGIEDLKFYNSQLQFVAEPGEFQVMVGANSSDTKMASFILK